MQLPSQSEIAALHRKYAPTPDAYDAVYTHSRIVWEIAEQLIKDRELTVDAYLVRTGCMLHDIGVYRFEGIGGGKDIGAEYIKHGLYSYEILKAEGFPEVLCRFGSHHTGVGLTKEDIINQNLPLPHEDLLAETAEERLVMYADKFNSKSTPPRFNSYESYRQYVGRFGEQKKLEFGKLAEEFGKPDLTSIAARYHQEII